MELRIHLPANVYKRCLPRWQGNNRAQANLFPKITQPEKSCILVFHQSIKRHEFPTWGIHANFLMFTSSVGLRFIHKKTPGRGNRLCLLSAARQRSIRRMATIRPGHLAVHAHGSGAGVREDPPTALRHALKRAGRKPRLLLRIPGSFLLRFADRQLPELLFQLPPRKTRLDEPVYAGRPSFCFNLPFGCFPFFEKTLPQPTRTRASHVCCHAAD